MAHSVCVYDINGRIPKDCDKNILNINTLTYCNTNLLGKKC